jgi:hypothetical protein
MNPSTQEIGRTSSTLRRLLAAAVILGSVGAQAAPITSQGTWTTTLLGRDAAGKAVDLLAGGNPNPALKYVYDTRLNLTWLADWNAGAGTSFDKGASTTDGAMTWSSAQAWAASLTDFGGGWVLPAVLDTGSAGCNQANAGTDCGYNVYGSEMARRDSPLAHMFYDTLGNRGLFDVAGNIQSGSGLINTGPFSNMAAALYWTGSAYPQSPAGLAWDFQTDWGSQFYGNAASASFAVAVRSGDVFTGAVPEPDAWALLGLAFGALAWVRRRWSL